MKRFTNIYFKVLRLGYVIKMKSRVSIVKSILHLFFPYACCGCGTDLLAENILFCIYCQASMPLTDFEYFPSNPIEKIFWGRAGIEAAAAHLYFTTDSAVQHSLHLLKYKGKKRNWYLFRSSRWAESLIHSSQIQRMRNHNPIAFICSKGKKERIQSGIIDCQWYIAKAKNSRYRGFNYAREKNRNANSEKQDSAMEKYGVNF